MRQTEKHLYFQAIFEMQSVNERTEREREGKIRNNY